MVHTHTLQTRIYDTAWTIPTRCTLEVQTSNLWDDAWNNLNFTTTTDHRYHAWPWWTYPHSWPWHPRSIQGRRPCFLALGWGHLQKPENPLVLIQNQVPDGSTEMVNSRRQNHMFAGRQLRLGPWTSAGGNRKWTMSNMKIYHLDHEVAILFQMADFCWK